MVSLRSTAAVVLAAGTVVVASCSKKETTGPSTPRVASIVVTPGTHTLTALGLTQQFSAVARDGQGNTMTGVTITWASTSPAVASVSTSGLATAEANGTTTIVASAGSVRGTASLTVAQELAEVVVSADTDTLMALGLTLVCTAEARDPGGNPIAGKTFSWASSDTLVATVSAGGNVAAVGNGTVTITATTDGVPGSIELVVEQRVSTVEVAPTTLGLLVGDSVRMAATVNDAEGYQIAAAVADWSTAHPSVATVTAQGKLEAVGTGSTTVSATVDGVADTVPVSVWASDVAVVRVVAPDAADFGETVVVDIMLDNRTVPYLTGALSVTLLWDPAVLDFQDAFIQEFSYLGGYVDSGAGELVFYVSEPAGVSGDLCLLTVQFGVIGSSGSASPLDLELGQYVAAHSFIDITAHAVAQDRVLNVN
ncbi:MAG: Ig-like domain-containing protein [Gemmatimonadota bacterium]|nr:MAG: Ig-like domain-containing protein [Gemmatimonadota bacterium]